MSVRCNTVSHGSLLRCGVAGGARSEAGLVQPGRHDARMLMRERVVLCLRDPRGSSCRGRLRGRGKEGGRGGVSE